MISQRKRDTVLENFEFAVVMYLFLFLISFILSSLNYKLYKYDLLTTTIHIY